MAEPYPVVNSSTSALLAAQSLAKDRLPGLVVTKDDGTPEAILPASQVMRFIVPDYVQQDPSLARVIGMTAADKLADRLRRATVGDLLPRRGVELAVVHAEDTVLELATVMARLQSPLCIVVTDGKIAGVVTAAHLLEHVCATLP